MSNGRDGEKGQGQGDDQKPDLIDRAKNFFGFGKQGGTSPAASPTKRQPQKASRGRGATVKKAPPKQNPNIGRQVPPPPKSDRTKQSGSDEKGQDLKERKSSSEDEGDLSNNSPTTTQGETMSNKQIETLESEVKQLKAANEAAEKQLAALSLLFDLKALDGHEGDFGEKPLFTFPENLEEFLKTKRFNIEKFTDYLVALVQHHQKLAKGEDALSQKVEKLEAASAGYGDTFDGYDKEIKEINEALEELKKQRAKLDDSIADAGQQAVGVTKQEFEEAIKKLNEDIGKKAENEATVALVNDLAGKITLLQNANFLNEKAAKELFAKAIEEAKLVNADQVVAKIEEELTKLGLDELKTQVQANKLGFENLDANKVSKVDLDSQLAALKVGLDATKAGELITKAVADLKLDEKLAAKADADKVLTEARVEEIAKAVGVDATKAGELIDAAIKALDLDTKLAAKADADKVLTEARVEEIAKAVGVDATKAGELIDAAIKALDLDTKLAAKADAASVFTEEQIKAFAKEVGVDEAKAGQLIAAAIGALDLDTKLAAKADADKVLTEARVEEIAKAVGVDATKAGELIDAAIKALDLDTKLAAKADAASVFTEEQIKAFAKEVGIDATKAGELIDAAIKALDLDTKLAAKADADKVLTEERVKELAKEVMPLDAGQVSEDKLVELVEKAAAKVKEGMEDDQIKAVLVKLLEELKLKEDIGKLEKEVKDINDLLFEGDDSVAKQVGDLKASVEKNTAGVEANKAGVAENKGDIGTNRDNIQRLKDLAGQITTTIKGKEATDKEEAVPGLMGQMKDLLARIEAIEKNPPTKGADPSELDALKRELDALKAQINSVVEKDGLLDQIQAELVVAKSATGSAVDLTPIESRLSDLEVLDIDARLTALSGRVKALAKGTKDPSGDFETYREQQMEEAYFATHTEQRDNGEEAIWKRVDKEKLIRPLLKVAGIDVPKDLTAAEVKNHLGGVLCAAFLKETPENKVDLYTAYLTIKGLNSAVFGFNPSVFGQINGKPVVPNVGDAGENTLNVRVDSSGNFSGKDGNINGTFMSAFSTSEDVADIFAPIRNFSDERATDFAIFRERLYAIFGINSLDVNVSERDPMGLTPVHLALLVNNTNALAALENHPEWLTQPDAFGNTPFHYAAATHMPLELSGEDYSHVSKLPYGKMVKEGADVFAANEIGITPIETALAHGNLAFIKWYMTEFRTLTVYPQGHPKHGSENDHNLLNRAIELGNSDSVKQVMRSLTNGQVNFANNQGDTPLHTAASIGKVDLFNVFDPKTEGKCRANIFAKNAAGKTPIEVAAASGNKEAVTWFALRGATLSRGVTDQMTALFNSKEIAGKATNADAMEAMEQPTAKQSISVLISKYVRDDSNVDTTRMNVREKWNVQVNKVRDRLGKAHHKDITTHLGTAVQAIEDTLKARVSAALGEDRLVASDIFRLWLPEGYKSGTAESEQQKATAQAECDKMLNLLTLRELMVAYHIFAAKMEHKVDQPSTKGKPYGEFGPLLGHAIMLLANKCADQAGTSHYSAEKLLLVCHQGPEAIAKHPIFTPLKGEGWTREDVLGDKAAALLAKEKGLDDAVKGKPTFAFLADDAGAKSVRPRRGAGGANGKKPLLRVDNTEDKKNPTEEEDLGKPKVVELPL